MNCVVFTTNAVYASKTLDQSDRVPVKIIVEYAGTVLEVLPFGYDVGSQQYAYLWSEKALIGSQIPGGRKPFDDIFGLVSRTSRHASNLRI